MPRANRANVFVRHLRIESEWYPDSLTLCSTIIKALPLLLGEPNYPRQWTNPVFKPPLT